MQQPRELERRWIVTPSDPSFLEGTPVRIRQGYFDRPYDDTLRVRIMDGKKAKLANKTGVGENRGEDEVSIDLETAAWLLRRCNWFVEKDRYAFGRWEIDVFRGPLDGLVVAEYERKENEPRDIELPAWFGAATEVTETVDNYRLARMAYDLAQIRNGLPIQDILLAKPLPGIVLTGAPCSGKSTALEAIRRELGHIVHPVPEVATILIAQLGFRPDSSKPNDYLAFQQTLARIQLDFEALAVRQAVAEGKRAIVLDRGIRDAAAYMDGGRGALYEAIRLRGDPDSLYRRVLVLDPPPRDIYERHQGNNAARRESYEEAIALDGRIRAAWEGHRDVYRVGGANMEEKTARVLGLIRAALDL